MSATCAITDITGQWGEGSVTAPRAAVEPSAPSYADGTMASPVDGADLLQFLRVAYAPPQTEAEMAVQLSSDLVKFLRDFGSTAPRPMGSGLTGAEYPAPRRVLLSEGSGRRRAPVALASLAASSSLRALRPAAAAQVRVPPYVAGLSGRGWIVGSGRELAEAAS
jgi:hypothetical protein